MSVSNPTPPASSAGKPWFDVLVSAHPSIDAPDERRKSELLSALSLGFLVLVALGSLASWLTGGQSFTFIAGFAFSIVAFFSYLLSRTSRYMLGGYLFVIGFSLLSYLTAFFDQATPSLTLMLTLSLSFLLANLFNLKQMVVSISVNLAVMVAFTLILLPQLRSQELVNTLSGIIVIGLFVLLFAWHRDNVEQLRFTEILKIQTNLEKSNLELQNAQDKVNTRFAELRLAAEVGRTVSQVRTLNVMLTDTVDLIRSQFDLYYVQVYLTNPSQTALILQAGTGTVGAELLSRAHRLPLNTSSINGRSAIEKRSIAIPDTKLSATFKPNPLLPDTRSELAVPLMIGERVVGVLDMQSREPNKLNQEGLTAFEALAGQLAIAIQNATFLAQTEQARAEIEAQARRQSRANWADYLDAIHKPEETGYVFENNQVAPFSAAEQPQIKENALSAPIEIIGASLGNLVVEMEGEGESPIALTSELVSAVARQVAQQIENLRLLESAERYRFEAEEASRRITQEGWREYIQSKAGENISFVYDLKEVKPFHDNGDQQAETAGYTLPLKARDEVIGKLVVQGLDTTNSESIELANAVAERLGAHLEGLRLSIQTEQALLTTKKLAEREQALRQITNAVRGSTDPATILRSAARELGTILGRKTVIRLTAGLHSEESILHDDKNVPFAAKNPSKES
jgi:GAF domain-containing protein